MAVINEDMTLSQSKPPRSCRRMQAKAQRESTLRGAWKRCQDKEKTQ